HQKRLIHKLTSVIEKNISKADKQTRDTRDIFGVPDAAGVVILINEVAHILTYPLVEYRVMDLFKTNVKNGSVRYPNNDLIIYLSEIHPIYIGTTRIFPVKTYINSVTKQRETMLAFSEKFTAAWA